MVVVWWGGMHHRRPGRMRCRHLGGGSISPWICSFAVTTDDFVSPSARRGDDDAVGNHQTVLSRRKLIATTTTTAAATTTGTATEVFEAAKAISAAITFVVKMGGRQVEGPRGFPTQRRRRAPGDFPICCSSSSVDSVAMAMLRRRSAFPQQKQPQQQWRRNLLLFMTALLFVWSLLMTPGETGWSPPPEVTERMKTMLSRHVEDLRNDDVLGPYIPETDSQSKVDITRRFNAAKGKWWKRPISLDAILDPNGTWAISDLFPFVTCTALDAELVECKPKERHCLRKKQDSNNRLAVTTFRFYTNLETMSERFLMDDDVADFLIYGHKTNDFFGYLRSEVSPDGEKIMDLHIHTLDKRLQFREVAIESCKGRRFFLNVYIGNPREGKTESRAALCGAMRGARTLPQEDGKQYGAYIELLAGKGGYQTLVKDSVNGEILSRLVEAYCSREATPILQFVDEDVELSSILAPYLKKRLKPHKPEFEMAHDNECQQFEVMLENAMKQLHDMSAKQQAASVAQEPSSGSAQPPIEMNERLPSKFQRPYTPHADGLLGLPTSELAKLLISATTKEETEEPAVVLQSAARGEDLKSGVSSPAIFAFVLISLLGTALIGLMVKVMHHQPPSLPAVAKP